METNDPKLSTLLHGTTLGQSGFMGIHLDKCLDICAFNYAKCMSGNNTMTACKQEHKECAKECTRSFYDNLKKLYGEKM